MALRVIGAGRHPVIAKVVEDDLFGIGRRVKEIDLWLELLLNPKSGRYEIHDSHPKVHPAHTLLLRVQTEEGGYRLPDSRDLISLRGIIHRSQNPSQVIDNLDEAEEARERDWKKGADAVQWLMMNEDLKWVGKDVVQSVRSRERSIVPAWKTSTQREAIRKEAFG